MRVGLREALINPIKGATWFPFEPVSFREQFRGIKLQNLKLGEQSMEYIGECIGNVT